MALYLKKYVHVCTLCELFPFHTEDRIQNKFEQQVQRVKLIQ
jgi:hypothetical protein